MRLRDTEHMDELPPEPAGEQQAGHCKSGHHEYYTWAGQRGAAQSKVDELKNHDRKIQRHMGDADAALPRIVKSKKINEAGYRRDQRASDASRECEVRGSVPAGIAGGREDDVRGESEDPQSDRDGDQHRMDRMACDGYACRHTHPTETRNRPE